MVKKTIIGVLAFIIGILIAYFSENYFRDLIQDIFKWSTSDKIKFVSKNFFVLSEKFYFFAFGIALLIFTIENRSKNLFQIFKSGILSLSIFGIVLTGISAIIANIKVVECTACEDGIRSLHWNDINYGLILGISVIISVIPNLIRILILEKKAYVQQRI